MAGQQDRFGQTARSPVIPRHQWYPERNTTLFNILQEHELVLESPTGKAIWRATVHSDSGWTQTFTLLKMAPSLIWEAEQLPTALAGRVVMEVAPTAESTDIPAANSESTPQEPHGLQFVKWLRDGLRQQHLALNDAKALLHTVDGTLFLVSPGIFHRYLQEQPEITQRSHLEVSSDWQWLQKQFEQLGMHRKRSDDLNLWTCEVHGPRKGRRLHGYLLLDPQNISPEVPFDNPYLALMSVEKTSSRLTARPLNRPSCW